ncbi:MAG: lamin tail domain-containing protein [Cyanobacteria bacterium P01_E01_bin.42]
MKINEFLADPAADLPGDANGDGTRNATQDEFIELINETSNSQDISGWAIADGSGDRHIFPNGTIVPAGGAIVVFGGGSPTGNFSGAIVQKASTGSLGLTNGGDTITLKDGSGSAIDTHTYGSEGSNNQSLTRNPDITGLFVEHTAVASSLFSPGVKFDGTPFAASASTLTPIYDIQGMGHISPLNGTAIATRGIVTAIASNGFYLQDATGDGNDATSDGIFVFTGSSPSVNVGDGLEVAGTVSEFTPGGASTGNLSITQIISPIISGLSTGNALPTTIVGNGGRTPIAQNIDDDNLTSFDPNSDGIDFWESLEGMRLQVNDAVAVSPTSRFGEIAVLADNGMGAGLRTGRGGILVRPDDFNPERIIIDDGLVRDEPVVNVGDRFNGSIQGVLSYSFGNYKLLNTAPLPGLTSGNLQPESTSLVPTNDALTVASYNVENLDPGDPDSKFSQLAQQIINNLASPDIIGLQEIQDNNGTTNDGIVAGDRTYQKLIDAIASAGGPTYEYRQIDPINNADGGAPGSNIRVGFLFNPTRVEFSDRGNASPTDANSINPNGVLRFGVGRVDPNNPAFSVNGGANFSNSRKSLAGEFVFKGERIFIVNNHFKSKGGDTPLFGTTQPADLTTETQRIAQATVINDFTESILNQDPNANIIILGDLNDFQFSPAVQTLADDDLTNLIDTLTPAERYTYNFEGNSQTLDHILVSDNLKTRAEVDVVHLNSEFASNSRSSDHDPVISRFNFSPSMDYTLQILHAADQEGGLPAIQDAVNFSAVINALDDDFANTLKLSSGDIYLPGPFFNASEEIYGEAGIGDILINNALGFQAVALGNHEFDRGTETISKLLKPDANITGPGITGSYQGTNFTYLSSNLDFSSDDNLKDLVVTDGEAPKPNSIAKSVVIDVNGERIGVIGATTPALDAISSPGDVGVLPGSSTDFNALAGIIQAEVDKLTTTGINKVVLLSHMQQIGIEKELAGLLEDVDVIMAGGSNTLLANSDDPLRGGDAAADMYPLDLTSKSGERVVVINTEGNYQYVGRLAVDFDTSGVISKIRDESGVYATDDAGVDRVYGMDVNPADEADPTVVAVTDAIANVVLAKDSNIFGSSEVFLNGTRGDVRTQETNLGNLTADANLFIAKQYDSRVVVSIKNGGGIRDNIGISRIPAGGTSDDLEELPTEANPLVGKEAGDISQLDIENTLRFNNGLTLLTVTAEGLKEILEHSVAAIKEGSTPGQFPQISGIRFSFDPAIAIDRNDDDDDDDDKETTRKKGRIRSAAIVDEAGNIIDVIVRDGEIVGDRDREIRLVTLGFLAGGGDDYPFDIYGKDRLDLTGIAVPQGGVDVANFTEDGSEQDALAEYLAAKFGDMPFRGLDASPESDRRIQNLAFREDTIFEIQKPQPKPDRRRNLERNDRNIFSFGSDRTKITLRLSLTEINVSTAVNEIGVVKVDDDEGRIGGIRRGEAGYIEAALNRGKTVFSALPDAIFASFNATRVLEFGQSDRLLFYMVQNSSRDIVLRDFKSGNAPPAVRFANDGNIVQISEDTDDLFSLMWDDGLGGTIKMRMEYSPDARMPLGIGLQGENERELIDLRGLGERSATITVRSEAAYSNTVGLYVIDNETGTIDGLNPGDEGYTEAAIARRVTQFGIGGTVANIEGLLAPFIIANSTVEGFLNNNTDIPGAVDIEVYFPYLAANSDGFDHLRLLGDNLFGFEDMSNGGDGDFDDMVFQVEIA